MTENVRTLTYIGIALVLLVAAGLVNRKPALEAENSLVGKPLFPELKSPSEVAGLEIVTADQDPARPKFKVIRDAGGWSLPSHSNYPADATEQVGSAAASLVGLEVLSVETTEPSEHAKYGVLDPEKASRGAEGVGKLVKMLDRSGNPVASLVIGYEDKGTGANTDSQTLRYVRAQSQDAVCRVLLPDAKFPTNFADWIETDLLKLNAWDITEVILKDYIADLARDRTSGRTVIAHQPTSTIELAFSDKDSKWSLRRLLMYENQEPKPVPLADDEELNATKLNELKTALDDLKIVDVKRKPAGISGNLKANKDVFADDEAVESLFSSGFFPGGGEGDQTEILSSDGEVLVRMKDGVEYTLRFGRSAGIGSEEEKEESDSEATKDSKKEDAPGINLNRYIMVSARFNQDLIPKPELQEVPKGPESENDEATQETPDAKKSSDAKSDAAAGKDVPGKSKTKSDDDGKEAPESEQKSPAEGDESAAGRQDPSHFVKFQDEQSPSVKEKSKPAGSAPKDATAGKSGDTSTKQPAVKTESTKSASKGDSANDKNAAAKSAASRETKVDAAKTSPAKNDTDVKNVEQPKGNEGETTSAAKKSDDPAEDESNAKAPSTELQEDLALQRKRIQQENDRKQTEYDDKIKKGEDRARELNARFADWYYVVSETTYRKIHLDRAAVIKKKLDEKKDDANKGTDLDAAADALKIDPLK
jgi:hypothetical protein